MTTARTTRNRAALATVAVLFALVLTLGIAIGCQWQSHVDAAHTAARDASLQAHAADVARPYTTEAEPTENPTVFTPAPTATHATPTATPAPDWTYAPCEWFTSDKTIPPYTHLDECVSATGAMVPTPAR